MKTRIQAERRGKERHEPATESGMAITKQEPDVRRVRRALAAAAMAVALLPPAAAAQEAVPEPAPVVSPEAPLLPPPSSFRTIALGMTVDEVKEALRQDALYQYRGDPDVSFLPLSDESLIECAGSSYLSRAYFQFAGGKLYVLILVLDPRKLDHYSMFTAFTAKYGEPSSFNPTEAVWQSASFRFSLERPLTVKYIDWRVFEEQVARGAAQEDLEQLSRERFIGQF